MTRPTPWLRRPLLLGAPLALAVLMLFHPWPYDNYLGELVPIAHWWTILHLIQFVLFPVVVKYLLHLSTGSEQPNATGECIR